jgi:hypothetical protein
MVMVAGEGLGVDNTTRSIERQASMRRASWAVSAPPWLQ